MNNPPDATKSHDLLKGKRVVITAGAGAGIGFATAKRCRQEGAIVMISDLKKERIDACCEELRTIQGDASVYGLLCDVRDGEEITAFVDEAITHMGGIDILINNAGLGGYGHVSDLTDEQWNSVIDVSLNSVFRMTRAVLPVMKKQAGGVIVNNASVLGWRAQEGQAHYAAAKAGVMALTRCVALEVARDNIRVNAVAPSLAMHPYLDRIIAKDELKKLIAQEAFGRAAEPFEVANVMIMLASDYTSYMTGEVISVSSQHP